MPPDAWGTVSHLSAGPSDACQTHLIGAPEGFVVVSRCIRCGRRKEGLLDLRPFVNGMAALRSFVDTDVSTAFPGLKALTDWARLHHS